MFNNYKMIKKLEDKIKKLEDKISELEEEIPDEYDIRNIAGEVIGAEKSGAKKDIRGKGKCERRGLGSHNK